MKGKEKDKKTGFPDFLKYRSNNLTGEEKNSFERELQKDPFAAEAEEGFSMVDPSILEKDKTELEKRLKSAVRRGKGFVWYRMAASIAVLMVIASLLIIVRKNGSEEISSVSEKGKTVFDISKPEALKDNIPLPPVAQNRETAAEEEAVSGADRKSVATDGGKTKAAVITAADTTEEMPVEFITADEDQVRAEAVQMEAMAPVAAKSAKKSNELKMVRGIVLSSEDNLPIPGATISLPGTTIGTVTDTGGNFALPIPDKSKSDLIASFIGMKSKEFYTAGDSVVRITMDPDLASLNEVVVTGYGVSRSGSVAGAAEGKKISVKDDAGYSYTVAEPAGGKDAFNKYVEENIVRPGQQSTQKAVVVLSFVVKLNGKPSGIRVIRSSGKQFSDEAIRLIMEGPLWKPASENGTDIEDEVRVRIVFK
jgi:hypothetical protein